MITLLLRYTIDPNKLSDIMNYAADEQIPIRESGGKIPASAEVCFWCVGCVRKLLGRNIGSRARNRR